MELSPQLRLNQARVRYARAALERASDHAALMQEKLDKLLEPRGELLGDDPPPECQDEWDLCQAAWDVYQAQFATLMATQMITNALYEFWQVTETNLGDCLSP